MAPLTKSKLRPLVALVCAIGLSATGAAFTSATIETSGPAKQEDWRCRDVYENDKPVTVCTFNYTGGGAWWTAPTGVTSVDVELRGAQGGTSRTKFCPSGGTGGITHATLTVTPLTRYQVTVGGKGGGMGTDGHGGYNGGGNGNNYAGGGGGATDVRINGGQLTDRVIVAGGGGGNNYYYTSCGGAGSGKDGDNGSSGASVAGGGGATWYRPGIGGWYSSGDDRGQDGDFGQGGESPYFLEVNNGGGGGGGWYGGGGGAGGRYGGGGGGSGFVNERVAQIVKLEQGGQKGNGLAIIRYPTPAR